MATGGMHTLLLLAWTLTLPAASQGAPGGKGKGKGKGADACASDYHNCFGSSRCCNPGSRCYTKAAGVRFAQCRPNGCVGTCGWECKVHTHKSGPPEYGAGAQNSSQAIAAMQQPLPVPTDGKPPSGRSERLGNIIDSWYFASLGVGARIASLLAMSCNSELSFGRFLATRLGAVSVSASQAASAIAEAGRHESWGFYTYPTIRSLMPQLRHDLRAAMRSYAETYDPSLSAQRYEGGRSHLVLHYRLGDFVTNSWCVPPKDIAAVAASLNPSVIEIMDGGVRHLDQVDGWSQGPHRANRSRLAYAHRVNGELQAKLEAALASAAPNARITRHTSASIDADWFRIAHAPLLVTGAGSFAVTAAIAGHASHIRTPAADNLNFPDRGPSVAEETMAHNWRTYTYDRSAMEGR